MIYDFDNFTLTAELVVKVFEIFEAYLSLCNNLCGKLVSSLALPISI